MQTLSALCPFTDGTSVYQARAMVKRFDTTEFFNACEYSQPQNSSSRFMNTATDLNTGKEALSTLVFPNPASTELTVTTDLDGAKLLIFNLVGQLVIESEINSVTKINVSEFKNGTYIYKIVIDNKIIKADKLIISK
ncbi:MAG: T9SS type A sorting domain-containing protein [Bacteroidota bacterium]|nr:T9SS type A sorting domain-containing protein [Bacteroidota bacterium]MDP3144901.1 T9SS type A sorting domain-containing protein [Bacteroidota bacterium]